MDLTWRPLTLADAAPLARLYAEAEKADRTGEHYSVEDFEEELAGPNLDLTNASTGAWIGDELVGYGLVERRDAANPAHMIRLQSAVLPEHRDDVIGSHLIEWFSRTSLEVHEKYFPGAPLELHYMAHENQSWIIGTLERAGYQHWQTLLTMRVGLDALPPLPPLPDGIEVVPFDFDYDLAVLDARNDTFGGHRGSTVLTPERWRHWVTGSKDFRPDLSFLVLSPSGDEVLAFVLTKFYPAEAEMTGIREQHISWVGTRAALRGRGIASGLLGHAVAAGKAAGFDRAMLSVDVDNAHRALGVYERCGFRSAEEWRTYVVPVVE
jgi:ribosomal protein S18 acetylase RimI-like enzyme